ncbi:hypothetical protein COCON_G00140680 [Conger conger]|uniref:Transmembrane protein 52 n=1 Tax=Conger conger TaxID=82655 RepID=A0A9Q1DB76_CONCO|nr:transmembrane protein 52-like [Conger conger]KAJ8264969.1 hypothetical protein COCON_G00140680 [Conger conger]
MRSIGVLITFLVLLVSFSDADEHCIKDCQRDFDPSTLWYVWVILVFISVLLGCGFIASCIRMCCRPNKPPVPMFEAHSLEVTVISMDNESTIRNISPVSSFSGSHPPYPFTAGPDNSFSPPPYNLYAMDSLPQYHEVVAMPTKVEDPGEVHQMCAPEEESTEFTQETLQQDGRQDVQGTQGLDEEEPPAYQPYSDIAEEEFNEIDLGELDPTDSHREDANMHEQNI